MAPADPADPADPEDGTNGLARDPAGARCDLNPGASEVPGTLFTCEPSTHGND